MITLHTFGPAFGLPDPSPFVTKAEMLLKLSGLPYRLATGDVRKAPKHKLPYIDDDARQIADSTFIRFHLEQAHGIDFDRPLNAAEKATAWAFEKMVEDHLYWLFVHERWVDDENFARGPARFFQRVPAVMRPVVVAMIRRSVRKSLHAQGTGRHSHDEMVRLATRDLVAMADFLADKDYFMGAEPTAVDATIFAFTAGALCPIFDSPMRASAERHDNLRRYAARMTARYYPDYPEMAGAKATTE